MPGFSVAVPHNLSAADAKNRIQKLVGDLQKQFAGMIQNVQEKWADDRADFSFDAMSFAISGSLFIEPSQVRIEGTLPMAALPFKGRIEEAVRSKATELLS